MTDIILTLGHWLADRKSAHFNLHHQPVPWAKASQMRSLLFRILLPHLHTIRTLPISPTRYQTGYSGDCQKQSTVLSIEPVAYAEHGKVASTEMMPHSRITRNRCRVLPEMCCNQRQSGDDN